MCVCVRLSMDDNTTHFMCLDRFLFGLSLSEVVRISKRPYAYGTGGMDSCHENVNIYKQISSQCYTYTYYKPTTTGHLAGDRVKQAEFCAAREHRNRRASSCKAQCTSILLG
jgi:hypothetical protein